MACNGCRQVQQSPYASSTGRQSSVSSSTVAHTITPPPQTMSKREKITGLSYVIPKK